MIEETCACCGKGATAKLVFRSQDGKEEEVFWCEKSLCLAKINLQKVEQDAVLERDEFLTKSEGEVMDYRTFVCVEDGAVTPRLLHLYQMKAEEMCRECNNGAEAVVLMVTPPFTYLCRFYALAIDSESAKTLEVHNDNGSTLAKRLRGGLGKD